MKDRVRNLKMDICLDLSSVEDMKKEYKKIINRINFHYDGLEDAINDFNNYKPNLEIKYSVAVPSSKSYEEGKSQWYLLF